MLRSSELSPPGIESLGDAQDHVVPRRLVTENVDDVFLQVIDDRAAVLLVGQCERAVTRLLESARPERRLRQRGRVQPEEQVQVEDVSRLRLGAHAQRTDLVGDHADRAVAINANGTSAKTRRKEGVDRTQLVVGRTVGPSRELKLRGRVSYMGSLKPEFPPTRGERLPRTSWINQRQSALPEERGQRRRFEHLVDAGRERFEAPADVVEVDVFRAALAGEEEPHVRAAFERELSERESDGRHLQERELEKLDGLARLAHRGILGASAPNIPHRRKVTRY